MYEYLAPTGLCGRVEIFLCEYYMSSIVRIGDFFGIVFLFSFTNLFLKNYFNRWYRFALWAVPLCLALLILLNLRLHHSSGGFMNMDDLFDYPIVIIIYGFFIVGSIVQLTREYRNRKKI